MKKPTVRAVSMIIHNPFKQKEFLLVRRPLNDREFPGVWSLPATYVGKGGSLASAVKRCGWEKLGVKVQSLESIGSMRQERRDYVLYMHDFICELVEGTPDVAKATTKGTRYIDQQWSSDFKLLTRAAREGACCSQVYLEYMGLLPRKQFIRKLIK